MNYLSKKTTWMIIAALVVIVGALAVSLYGGAMFRQNQTSYTTPPSISTVSNSSPTILADSDWQKVLVGTGVTVPGKADAPETASSSQSSLTETAKIGQYLVSGYMQLQQSGETISTDTIDSLVSSALSDPNVVSAAKVYAFSDIKIGKDDNILADMAYGQSIAALFKKNPTVGNEATYARDSEEQSDPTILAKIDPIVKAYQNILSGLLATAVPPSLAQIHLNLVNAMSERLAVAKLLRSINTDPAAGLEGAGQYLNALQDFLNAFKSLEQYFGTIKADTNQIIASSTSREQAYQQIINENYF
ncbi:MAG: hypothetical protein P4L61_03855 [Candidatus Pacebacteria bacterium]|nr:hypothetical protein [Candidatus Paceibacterota bacterium]